MKGANVSEARAILSREWKKVKSSDKKMKTYRDPYKAGKGRYEEALQRYQEDHMDKFEIISLHKRCDKAGVKAGVKAGAKAPRSGERRSKKIKEDPPRLSAYNNTAKRRIEDWRGLKKRKWSQIRRWPAWSLGKLHGTTWRYGDFEDNLSAKDSDDEDTLRVIKDEEEAVFKKGR